MDSDPNMGRSPEPIINQGFRRPQLLCHMKIRRVVILGIDMVRILWYVPDFSCEIRVYVYTYI